MKRKTGTSAKAKIIATAPCRSCAKRLGLEPFRSFIRRKLRENCCAKLKRTVENRSCGSTGRPRSHREAGRQDLGRDLLEDAADAGGVLDLRVERLALLVEARAAAQEVRVPVDHPHRVELDAGVLDGLAGRLAAGVDEARAVAAAA